VQDGASKLSDGAVAVIGGGWAGCAAAVALARRGIPVHLFEAAPALGGRARRVERAGLALDNGQHLLLGAYADALALIDFVHEGRAPLARLPLTIAPLSRTRRNSFALTARGLPAPFGLLAGLLLARGFGVRERFAAMRWFSALARRGFERPPRETVAELIAPLPARVASALCTPLCIAALNTPVASASAPAFANVLRLAFASRRSSSDFVLPATDLSSLFPDAAARYVVAQGGRVTTRASVAIESIGDDRVSMGDGGRTWNASRAIVAVGPHQLRRAFAGDLVEGCGALAAALAACDQLVYEPIATVYLGYRDRFALPCRITRLDDAPGQWAFERSDILSRSDARTPIAQVVAVVISASGPHDALSHDALVDVCDAQLRRLRAGLPPLAWSQAIVERRATFACVPERARPPHVMIAPNVALAGDYMHATLPATLESAVQSGLAAAHAIV
jgi:squalene-associated FAD-dependent desaturase